MNKMVKKIGLALGLVMVTMVTPAKASNPGYVDHFISVNATASGNTLVWTPTSGKSFRVMGWFIQITGQSLLASAGTLHATFYDGTATATAMSCSFYIPALGLNAFGAISTPFVDAGIGYLSVAADNPLYIHLDKTLNAGEVHVYVQGVEEP